MRDYDHLSKTLRVVRRGFLLTFVVMFFSLAQWAQAATTDARYPAPPSLADLADAVRHAVVNISTTQVVRGRRLQPFLGPFNPFGGPFGRNFPRGEMRTHALGSGFVIDKSAERAARKR